MRCDRVSIFAARFLALTLAILATSATLLAQEPAGGWVGKRVVPRSPTFSLKLDNGMEVEQSKGSIEVFRVEKVNGSRLWLRESSLEGWVLAREVVTIGDAVDHFTKYIRDNPGDPFGFLMRAKMYCNGRKKLDLALTDYNAAIRLDPKHALTYIERGSIWLDKEDYDKAFADYNQAIKLEPRLTLAYLKRAKAWDELRQFDKALADYDLAIQIDPNNSNALNSRAGIWWSKGDQDKAIADYGRAIQVDPQNATAYYNRGVTWSDKKDFDKAIADHDQAIRLIPTFALAYHERATSWEAKGEVDKAIADYTLAARFNPYDASAYLHLGDLWRIRGEYDKALADYDQAIRLEPESGWNRYKRAIGLLIASRDGAERDARAAIQRAGWRDSLATYSTLIGHVGERRAKREDVANRLLEEGAKQCDPAVWPYPIVRFLRREIDEPALLALAVDQGKQTEVRCYLGLDHLLAGRIDAARGYFRWVKEHGKTSFVEYTIAVSELNRLEPKAKP
jgi:tetratricopeptide (TPR) repeat protein